MISFEFLEYSINQMWRIKLNVDIFNIKKKIYIYIYNKQRHFVLSKYRIQLIKYLL